MTTHVFRGKIPQEMLSSAINPSNYVEPDAMPRAGSGCFMRSLVWIMNRVQTPIIWAGPAGVQLL